jgi:N-methylhydantoinase A/oxoprolinase/acetone carboxylase beta subunit
MDDPEFSVNIDLARHAFAESLEELALDRVRNPDKGKGSDILLLGLLNANMPAKFRPQLALNEDSAKELITEWRKAAKEIKKEKPAEEGAAVLNEDVEKTLAEILEKRGTDSKQTENSE